jgi:hypothetical protein
MIIKRLVSLGVLISISCSIFTMPLFSNKSVSKMISASQGGELTLPDKTVLKIPAGSLQSDTQVTLSKVSGGNIPPASEMTSVGSTYQIDLGSASLQQPATLEIPFDPTLLPDGSDPGQVFLTYYDETSKEWVYAGGVVDTARNVVVLDISHASLWRPATWNWAAWIAVLDKLLSVSVVDFVDAVQLLTNDCPQTGNYVQVDSSQALNLIQGCVDVDDSQQPQLRIVNPKSFFYEIKPISGGNGYPAPSVLGPGDEVKFEASTSDPSPLIIQAEMTQKSGWYLVIHMIITLLPGANQFGIQPSSVACITERLADVSDIAGAVESLLNNDGAAAAESISNFMLDGEAVRRFLTAADDCHFGPAPTWSLEGVKQIGGAVSTIMSATDYIANYFAGNTDAQLSFSWTSPVDMTNPESIAAWINYGLKNADAGVFNNIITEMLPIGSIYSIDNWDSPAPCQVSMGPWCDISKNGFVQEIQNRIQSKPKCVFYIGIGNTSSLNVITFIWDPLWIAPIGDFDSIEFSFKRDERVTNEFILIGIKLSLFRSFWLDYAPCP